MELEKFLITTPKIQDYQRSVQLKQRVANVPFGARGRKRNTLNLMYIGCSPNPDNRPCPGPPLVEIVQPTFNQPAKRTYARVASAPAPASASSYNREPDEISTSPANHLLSIAESLPTINIDFDADFGRLNYSSDSDT